ncbi:MAG: dTDP-4-dehydrorhamnose 3,5-epimerase, partial [uncultured Craurococcus sp.]
VSVSLVRWPAEQRQPGGDAVCGCGSCAGGIASVWRPPGFLRRELQRAGLRRDRHPGRLRAGQPLALRAGGDGARAALPVGAACPGQAGAGAARRDPRCRRRYPPRLADLWAACRGRADGGERAPALRPGRLRAWLLHAPARDRGGLQGHRLLRARLRSRHRLERSGPCPALALRGGGGAALRQGPPGAAAARCPARLRVQV